MAKKIKLETPAFVRAYMFHGVGMEFVPGATKAQGDCPFCGAENKFFVDVHKSLFRCVICDSKGNLTSFLKRVHQMALKETTLEDYAALAQERQIPIPFLGKDATIQDHPFYRWGLAVNPLNGKWVIPAHTDKGKMGNLYKWTGIKGKQRAMSTPTMNLYPFGLDLITKSQDDILLMEGPWDAIATDIALRTTRQRNGNSYLRTKDESRSMIQSHASIGVPGAGTFPAKWMAYFKGRHIRLCFDNDHPRQQRDGSIIQPGPNGMIRIANLANGSTKSLTYLGWGGPEPDSPLHDEALSDGYDAKDLINDRGSTKAIKYLLGYQRPHISSHEDDRGTPDIVDIEPIPCTSFDELLTYFEDLHITRLWKDCFALMLATIISTHAKGNPVWLRVIGPPSSGKTLLAECMSVAKSMVWALSTFSGFVSGFKGKADDNGETKDSSLIPKLDGKCLIVKDGDTLMSNDGKDRILAELRDLFDGVTRAHYRNQEARVYENLRTSIILCGTNQLRQLNRANLGERFLDTEIASPDSRAEYAKSAAKQAVRLMKESFADKGDEDSTKEDTDRKRKAATLGFMLHIKDNIDHVHLPDHVLETVLNMAEFLAHMRARVHKDEMDSAPEIEMPARIVTQLVKIASYLSIVLGDDEADHNATRVIRNVVMSTAKGRQLDTTLVLHASKQGLQIEQIAGKIKVSTQTARRIIDDMIALDLVEHVALSRNGRAGRKKYVYRLTKSAMEMTSKALS